MRSLSLVMSECSLSGRGQGHVSNFYIVDLDKKFSYRRGTARCAVSIKILPLRRNSAETTYTTSPDQIDGMKLEI